LRRATRWFRDLRVNWEGVREKWCYSMYGDACVERSRDQTQVLIGPVLVASRQWSGVYGIFGRRDLHGARIAAPQRRDPGRRDVGRTRRAQVRDLQTTVVAHCAGPCCFCTGQQSIHCLPARGCQLSGLLSLPWIRSARSSTKHSNRHTHNSAPLFVQLPDRLLGSWAV
jgi:hypothetical protein